MEPKPLNIMAKWSQTKKAKPIFTFLEPTVGWRSGVELWITIRILRAESGMYILGGGKLGV